MVFFIHYYFLFKLQAQPDNYQLSTINFTNEELQAQPDNHQLPTINYTNEEPHSKPHHVAVLH